MIYPATANALRRETQHFAIILLCAFLAPSAAAEVVNEGEPKSLVVLVGDSTLTLESSQSPDKPKLFLVGDSLMKTGSGNGETGPWGWASEIGALFDRDRIEVINSARGGRSSRSFMNEGAWNEVLAQLEPGDFVIVGFGHNDIRGSENHPSRTTITGTGEETIRLGVGSETETVHTFGWYLRKYIREARQKGATAILCSPVPRKTWKDGKIVRGFDGYAGWAEESARTAGAPFIDLNARSATAFDALGEQVANEKYNDQQHTNNQGAQIVARAAAEGIRTLENVKLKDYILNFTDN